MLSSNSFYIINEHILLSSNKFYIINDLVLFYQLRDFILSKTANYIINNKFLYYQRVYSIITYNILYYQRPYFITTTFLSDFLPDMRSIILCQLTKNIRHPNCSKKVLHYCHRWNWVYDWVGGRIATVTFGKWENWGHSLQMGSISQWSPVVTTV